jgi:hypothetical protein
LTDEPVGSGAASEAEEARRVIDARLSALEAMSWEELDLLGSRVDRVVTPSGRRFEVETVASWDGPDWEAGIELGVRVRLDDEPEDGEPCGVDWDSWPYSGWSRRGGPDDPVPDPPGGWRAPSRLAWPATAVLLVALILGIGTLGYFVAGAGGGAGLAVGLALTVSSIVLLRRIDTRRRPVRRSQLR